MRHNTAKKAEMTLMGTLKIIHTRIAVKLCQDQ